MNEDTGIEVTTGFFPLAIFLFFCTPVIEIDGHSSRHRWGTCAFDVDPGSHHVRIWFPYLFWTRCGEAGIDVTVVPGRTTRVRFYMPPLVFLPGSISAD